MKRHWVFRLIKSLLRVGLALAFPDAKPEKPKYTAAHAADLYEEGLIGDDEYARCAFGDD